MEDKIDETNLTEEITNAIEPLQKEIDYTKYENIKYKSIIVQLIKSIEGKFLEREEITRIAILALFAEKNFFLIGKPGVGKTAFCKVLSSIITNCKFWEIQFSKGTKEKDLFAEELFEGTTIATAEFLFVDELFKGEDTVLNKLLPVLNERYITLHGQAVPIKAKTTVGASNELPSGAILDPFVDRFHFMYEVIRIQDPENRRKFITGQFVKNKTLPRYFTFEEAAYIKQKSLEVIIPLEFQNKYLILMEKTIKEGLKCTDRKYGHAIEILKMSAFLNNRDYLNASDIFIFKDIGWTTYNERTNLKRILYELMFGNKIEIQEKLSKIEIELERVTATKDSDFKDFLHYNIEFNGKQKELHFNKIKEDISTLSHYYNNFMDEVGIILMRYEEVKRIEEEINENIFIIGVKNKVFTEEILTYLRNIYDSITENNNECYNWLSNNRTLYDYEESYYEKHDK